LTDLTGTLQQLDLAVRRQAERFSGVLELGVALSSARDLDALLELVIARMRTLVGAEAATLFMLDEERGELWSRVLSGSSLDEIRIPRTTGIAGFVVNSGQALSLSDAYADPRFNPEVDRKSGFRTGALIASPLRHVSGRILGVVEVLHRDAGAFTAEDKVLVEAVSSQIAGVLDNVLLLEQLRRRNEELLQAQGGLSQAVAELDLLYDVERAVSSTEGQTDLLDGILERAARALQSSSASILLIEDNHGDLYFRSARGHAAEGLKPLALKPGQGIAGRVADTGEALRVEDANTCPFYDPTFARMLGVEIAAVLCVPVRDGEKVVGALELMNKPGGYDEADERLATLLAGQTGRAIALRKARDEETRRERLATIGQMLSGVMHDLRTPMTIIAGYGQLLADEADPAERAKLAEILEKQVEHINGMTKETLAFARGEQDLLVRKVYLQNFIQEVEGFLKTDFARSPVKLTVDSHYDGVARFDENKIKRVIYNLARNAAQAMPGGGHFTFRLDREGDALVMRFEDDGPGIPEEIAGKLFQSFVTSGKKGGTGLGLAIVKKIAEEHGGSIEADNQPEGGAYVRVVLPLAAQANAQPTRGIA
jgi:signal transduction histidine kinase